MKLLKTRALLLSLVAILFAASTTNLFSQLSLEVVWEKPQSGVIDAKFSPDGNFVYCLIGGDIKKLDVETGEFVATFNRDGFTNTYAYLEITQDGKYILTGGYDGSVNLWNTEQQKILRSLSIPGQTGKQSLVFSTFSPDNKTVIVTLQTSHDFPKKPTNEIVLYDFIDNKVIKKVPFERIGHVQFSKDGKFFITATKYDENCRISLWDAKEMTVIREFTDLGADENGFIKIQLSDNNKLIGLATHNSNIVKILETETGKILQTNNPNTSSTIFSLLPFDFYLICEWSGDGTSDYSMNIYKAPNIFQSSTKRYGSKTIISKAIKTGEDSNKVIVFLGYMTLLTNSTTSVIDQMKPEFNIKVELEKITVSFENADRIKIIDMKGKVLLDQEVNEPVLSIPNSFSVGTYICVVKSGNREFSKKFQIVR